MGWVGRLLSFIRAERNGAKVSDVQVDTGGGPNITAEHFAAAGDDAYPLETDYVSGHNVQQTGREAITGYLDPINEPKAQEGEKRIYGRDADTGAMVVEVWLKNSGEAFISNENGSVTLFPDGSTRVTTPASTFDCAADGSIAGVNGSGQFELQSGGNFVVNGVTIDTAGAITTPTSITTPSAVVNGVEVDGHDHSQANDSGGNTEQDTGPMQ